MFEFGIEGNLYIIVMEFMLNGNKKKNRTMQYFVLPHMNFNVPGHVWFKSSVTIFGNVGILHFQRRLYIYIYLYTYIYMYIYINRHII